jgi:NTE family protein
MPRKRNASILSGGPGPASDRIALVLAGGKALGAFEAGAYEKLHDAGIRPDWIVGSSIGAINGALIAGNPVEGRMEALRRFWQKAIVPSPVWGPVFALWGEASRRWAAQAEAMAFGSPAVFAPNPFSFAGYALPAPPGSMGFYDLTPLRRSLEEFVDFELLNRGGVRLTVVATDLETGEEVVFDTERTRIGPEHIIASGAMLTEFPPVDVGGRLYVDGGLQSNLPIDVVRREARENLLCFAFDLFSGHGRRFRNLVEATVRRQELMLVSQAHLVLQAHEREEALRRALRAVIDLVPEDRRGDPEVSRAVAEAGRAEITLVRMAWPSGEEVGVNTYDWSERTLSERWEAGQRAASAALRNLHPAQEQPAQEQPLQEQPAQALSAAE